MGCATVKTHHIQSMKAEFLSMPTLVMPPPKPHTHSLQVGVNGLTGVGESMVALNDNQPSLNTRIVEMQEGEEDDVENFVAAPGDYRIDWEKVGYHIRYDNAPNERLSLFGSAQGGQVNGDLFTAIQLGMNVAFLFPHITLTVTPALGWQDNRITYVDSVVEYYSKPAITDTVWVNLRKGQRQFWHPQTAIALTLSRAASPEAIFIPYLGFQHAMAWVRTPVYPSDVLGINNFSLHGGLRLALSQDLALNIAYSGFYFGNPEGTRGFSRAEVGLIHAFGESH